MPSILEDATSTSNNIHPIFFAFDDDDEEKIKSLITNSDFNINIKDPRDDCTPLLVASEKGLLSICMILLAKGADVHSKDHYNNNCLHYSCECGNTNLVKFLIENGADFCMKNDVSLTSYTQA